MSSSISQLEAWATPFPPGKRARVPGKPGLGIVVQADSSLRWTLAETRRNADGRKSQHQTNLPARSWAEALSHYEQARGKIAAGETVVPVGDKRVVDATRLFLEEFEDKVARGMKKKKTVKSYRTAIEKHIDPFFRGVLLKNVTAKMIDREFVPHLREKPGRGGLTFSDWTMCGICNVLNLSLERARKEGWILANPYADVDDDYMPRQRPRKENAPRLFRNEELVKLFQACNPLYRDMLIVLAYTGLRIGELCGLQWSDIRLDEEYLEVETQIEWDEVECVWRRDPLGPKGEALADSNLSLRTVGLLPAARAALQRQRQSEWAKGFGKDSDWVFTTSLYHGQASGAPVRADNFRERGVQAAALAAGLGHTKPHDFRHTTASLLAAHDVTRVDAAKWMGHTELTYSRRYAKAFEDAQSRKRTLSKLSASGHGAEIKLAL